MRIYVNFLPWTFAKIKKIVVYSRSTGRNQQSYTIWTQLEKNIKFSVTTVLNCCDLELYNQGYWKQHEWVKLNGYYNYAKFDTLNKKIAMLKFFPPYTDTGPSGQPNTDHYTDSLFFIGVNNKTTHKEYIQSVCWTMHFQSLWVPACSHKENPYQNQTNWEYILCACSTHSHSLSLWGAACWHRQNLHQNQRHKLWSCLCEVHTLTVSRVTAC